MKRAIKFKNKAVVLIVGLILIVSSIAGCSSHENTNTTKTEAATETENKNSEIESIDIDFDSMTPDEAYNKVIEIKLDPKSYIGKTVRLTGVYNENIIYTETKEDGAFESLVVKFNNSEMQKDLSAYSTITVTGKLNTTIQDNFEYPEIEVDTVEILDSTETSGETVSTENEQVIEKEEATVEKQQ